MNQLQLIKAISQKQLLDAAKRAHPETVNRDMAGKVIAFVKENPAPEDEVVHGWAEANGMEKGKAEELIYQLAAVLFAGGDSKGSKIAFDGDQLRQGIEAEMEHLDRNHPFAGEAAKKIASDHLAQSGSGKYYTWLKWMEAKMKMHDTPKEFEAALNGEQE